MNRRTFLTAAGVSSAVGLAGCSGGSGGSSDPESTSTKKYGLMELAGGQWMAKEYVRYYDDGSQSLEKLKPKNDWWYEFTVTFKNLGDEDRLPPQENNLGLRTDGTTHPVLGGFRGVSWDDIRLRDEHSAYWVNPRSYQIPITVPAGDDVLVYLLFDADADDSPLLEVDYEEETAYLDAQKVHSP